MTALVLQKGNEVISAERRAQCVSKLLSVVTALAAVTGVLALLEEICIIF